MAFLDDIMDDESSRNLNYNSGRGYDPFMGPRVPPVIPAAPDVSGVTSGGMSGPTLTPSPSNPLDAMLGRYQQSEQNYTDLLNKGPEQFKPSIWRRLGGIALGTAAGLPSHHGLGRYGYESGDPKEAFNVARTFTFGPQGKMNEDYKRRLEAAKSGMDTSYREYGMARQSEMDDLQRQNIRSEMEARNRPQIVEGYRVPQEGGAAEPIPIDYGSQLPEQAGQPAPGTLPEVIKAKEMAPIQSRENINQSKLDQQYDLFQQSDDFKRWKTSQDNATKERVAAMRNSAVQNKAPGAVIQAGVFSQGALKELDNAEKYMSQLQASGILGQSWFGNKIEDIIFRNGAVDPSLSPEVREAISGLRASLGYTSSATMKAHTGRTSQEIYNDFKSRLGMGQDFNALRGAITETRNLLNHYVDAASDDSIKKLRAGTSNPNTNYTPENPPPGMTFNQNGPKGPGFYRNKPNAATKQPAVQQ